MYLHEVSSDEFILIRANWTAGMARRFVQEMSYDHVIVHREDVEDYYYLYTRGEALQLLSAGDPDRPVSEVLDLHESGATETLEAFTDADEAYDRTVVLDNGRLVGFLDVTLPPVRSFGPPATRGSRGAGAGGGEAVPRSLTADFPAKVPVGETASLLVSLSAEQPLSPGLPLALPVGSQVDIVVQPQQGLVLEGRGEGQLTVEDDQETLPLQFRLKAVEAGIAKVRVLAFHGGNPLGSLTLAPTVVAADDPQGVGPRRSHDEAVLPPQVVAQPDLQLLILEGRSGDNLTFTIRLSAADPNLNLHLKPFGPIELRMDPLAFFQDFFQDIENLSFRTAEEKQIASLRLGAKGLGLFNALFPEDLRVLLWELKDRLTTVEVESEEAWIPWELCKLEGKEDGRTVSGPFLCESYAITRWIPGIGRVPSVKMKNVGLVVPSDSGLKYAPAERDYMLSLASGGRQVTAVSAKFVEVHRALSSGLYDTWHFTGHGLFSHQDPNRSGIQLEGGFDFTPGDLNGEVKNLGLSRPLVFLNACQVGRTGRSLTDIGGFAAQFLRAGAAAFIGSYWSIFDQAALDFAQAFYNAMISGEAIGQAAQKARAAIRREDDPTWLAYTVYAHPLASVA